MWSSRAKQLWKRDGHITIDRAFGSEGWTDATATGVTWPAFPQRCCFLIRYLYVIMEILILCLFYDCFWKLAVFCTFLQLHTHTHLIENGLRSRTFFSALSSLLSAHLRMCAELTSPLSVWTVSVVCFSTEFAPMCVCVCVFDACVFGMCLVCTQTAHKTKMLPYRISQTRNVP